MFGFPPTKISYYNFPAVTAFFFDLKTQKIIHLNKQNTMYILNDSVMTDRLFIVIQYTASTGSTREKIFYLNIKLF